MTTNNTEPVIDISEVEDDLFPTGATSTVPTVDMSLIVGLVSDRSVAATELASEVGSVVGMPREAFLKSFTFYQDPKIPPMIWDIQLQDDPDARRNKSSKLSLRPPSTIKVVSVEGCLELSRIIPGDYLKSVNDKRIGPSYNAERAKQLMKDSLKQEGVLSVMVKNKEEFADDILIHATIIKPKPKMTYDEMGMVVWKFGYLCIKSIEKTSVFKRTALKPNDQLISINEIVCDEVTPEQVATILTALPGEITVTVLRRKQRLSGQFG